MSNQRLITHIYPRGTYKAPQFYFRGDDALKEPEYLEAEYRAQLERNQQLKVELEKEKAEYEEAQKQLSRKDGYTVALASALGDDSHATEDSIRLKQEIADLNAEIESIDAQIAEAKAKIDPRIIGGMTKERVFYHVEIQDQKIAVNTAIEDIRSTKLELASLVCSPKFSEAHRTEGELVSEINLLAALRSKKDAVFRRLGQVSAGRQGQRKKTVQTPPSLAALLDQKKDRIHRIDEYRNVLRYAEDNGEQVSRSMLQQIQEMNQVLVSLGGEEIDIEQIEANIRHPGDTPNASAEEEAAGSTV